MAALSSFSRAFDRYSLDDDRSRKGIWGRICRIMGKFPSSSPLEVVETELEIKEHLESNRDAISIHLATSNYVLHTFCRTISL